MFMLWSAAALEFLWCEKNGDVKRGDNIAAVIARAWAEDGVGGNWKKVEGWECGMVWGVLGGGIGVVSEGVKVEVKALLNKLAVVGAKNGNLHKNRIIAEKALSMGKNTNWRIHAIATTKIRKIPKNCPPTQAKNFFRDPTNFF
jgi:hypothetical protein